MDLWVFDNDGTLYDDSETHKNFMDIFCEYSSNLLRVPIHEVSIRLVELKNKWNTEFSIIALMREFEVDYADVVSNTYLKVDLEKCNVPKSDLMRKKVLNSILSEKIVLTNNPSIFARRILSHIGLANCFSDLIGMEETRFFGKPDMRAFQIVESRHPNYDRIIFCDDSLKNLDAAHKMGWITIWYRPLNADNGEVGGKHLVINSFNEIRNIT